MRTRVRVTFDSQDIPGGARTILAPVGCDNDVAVVADAPIIGRLPVRVTLYEGDERLPQLIHRLESQGIDHWFYRRDVYTDEELEAARLLLVYHDNLNQVFAGPRIGTSYDMANACPGCGAGARQTSALIVESDTLSEIEGRRAGTSYYSDLLVDERLANELLRIGTTGLSFTSVYARLEDKRQIKLKWQQARAERVLPPLSPQTTGLHRFRSCPACVRSGLASGPEWPIRFAYRARDIAEIDDVNLTWEWFGEFRYEGDVSDALFPYPWLLVTPKVWRAFRDAEVTDFEWIPIRIVDE